MIKLQTSLCFVVPCLLVLFLCPHKNLATQADGATQDVCTAEKDSVPCSTSNLNGDKAEVKETIHNERKYEENANNPESDSLLHRSMQGLEGVIDKMSSSKDEMMNNFIDKVSESRTKVMEGLDSMMDKMSESGTKVKEGFDSMLEKVSTSKEKMMEGLDNVLDQVSHSKMMEEIEHVIESVSHSQVMQEIRALPQEIRESFILSARNRSYVAAGVLVAIAAAILFGGAIYYAWCHHDAWSYYIGTIDEAKALLRQAKGRLSRSSSEDNTASEKTSTSHENSLLVKDIQSGESHTDEDNQNLVSSNSDLVGEKQGSSEKANGCKIMELKSEITEEAKNNSTESNGVSILSNKNIKHCGGNECEDGVTLEGKKDK